MIQLSFLFDNFSESMHGFLQHPLTSFSSWLSLLVFWCWLIFSSFHSFCIIPIDECRSWVRMTILIGYSNNNQLYLLIAFLINILSSSVTYLTFWLYFWSVFFVLLDIFLLIAVCIVFVNPLSALYSNDWFHVSWVKFFCYVHYFINRCFGYNSFNSHWID